MQQFLFHFFLYFNGAFNDDCSICSKKQRYDRWLVAVVNFFVPVDQLSSNKTECVIYETGWTV